MMRRKTPLKVQAYYNGKVVDMNHIEDPKQRFSLACYRVCDNSGRGYVTEGDCVYLISPASRMAKLLSGTDLEEARAVIAAAS